MNKEEFKKTLIFYIFKENHNGDVYSLKNKIKTLLNTKYEDNIVNDVYVKIINYQIKKYGQSLYSPEIRKK